MQRRNADDDEVVFVGLAVDAEHQGHLGYPLASTLHDGVDG